MARRVEVQIVGDSRSLERAFGRSAKSSSRFSQALKQASIIGAGAVVAASFKAVAAASNLGEQISKTGVVFKQAAPEILKWSKTTAAAIGTSQRAALEAAGTFGNMLVPMGLARGEAAAMSKRLVILGADLASFNNAGTAETLDAIRAGLAGETEPLRRFGVFLTAARVEQEAMNLGLKVGKEELSAVAKAQATYSLILKDTKDAQGDFARTSGSVANQTRIVKAQIEDTAAALGESLLPVAAAALAGINRFVQEAKTGFAGVRAAIAPYVTGIAAAGAATAAFLITMGGFRVVAAAKAAFIALNAAMAANPAIRIALIVGALVAAIVTLYRESETARRIMNAAFGVIRAAAGRVVGAVRAIIGAVQAVASSPVVKTIGAVIAGAFGVALAMIERVVGAIRAVANAAQAAAGAVKRAFGGGRDASKTDILNPSLRGTRSTKSRGPFMSPAVGVALAGLNPGAGNQNLIDALRVQEAAAAQNLARAQAAANRIPALRAAAEKATGERRKQILDAIAKREQDLIQAAQELQGIKEQIASLEAQNAQAAADAAQAEADARAAADQAARDAAAAAEDNRKAGFDAQIALARLTTDTADDIAAARAKEAELVAELAAAQAEGNNSLIAQLADALFSIRQDITQQTTSATPQPANELTLNVYPQGAAAQDPRALANAIGWMYRTSLAT